MIPMRNTATPEISLSILVVDDDPGMRRTVATYLEARHHAVKTAACGREGLDLLAGGGFDVVITDVKMPDMTGFDVLRSVKEQAPQVEVIMMTAFGEMETTVRALREGAFDFFTKPFDVQDLAAALHRTVRFQALRRERDRLEAQVVRFESEDRQEHGLTAIVGDSPEIREVRELVRQVATAGSTSVLITGETGTGKELVARAIHLESDRRHGPFVAVDCSAIPENLLESEFYGHVKGSFTDARDDRAGHFEAADGGTLFLDEVGDMDPGMQSKLLRTLEERRVRRVGGREEISVDVRVVSATNRDLATETGSFRRDLYYRLNSFSIHIPPLRERARDIPSIARHFLDRYRHELHRPIEGIGDAALDLLSSHPFPGNVRELRNLVERAAILCCSPMIDVGDLRFDPVPEAGPVETQTPDATSQTQSSSADLRLDLVEKATIEKAMRRTGGNQVQASELLGITRDALRRRLRRYGIDPGDYRG